MEPFKDTTTNGKKVILNKAAMLTYKPFFHSYFRIISTLIFMSTLIVVSCDSDDPMEVGQCPPVQHVNEFQLPTSALGHKNAKFQLLPFTGRDSFGIAFDAAVVGDIERVSAGGDSALVELTGTGQSSLLGELAVTHIHFVDLSSNEIRRGRFTFQSESGETVSGTYEGTRIPAEDGFTISGKAKVTGGDVVCTPTALETGWGWINGSLTDNRFDYQLEGWLFHHAEVN